MSGKQALRGYAVISTTGINKKLRMCRPIIRTGSVDGSWNGKQVLKVCKRPRIEVKYQDLLSAGRSGPSQSFVAGDAFLPICSWKALSVDSKIGAQVSGLALGEWTFLHVNPKRPVISRRRNRWMGMLIAGSDGTSPLLGYLTQNPTSWRLRGCTAYLLDWSSRKVGTSMKI